MCKSMHKPEKTSLKTKPGTTNLMSKKSIISPISIDLGAKNTGVYFTHYEEGSSIENIEKEGKVYILEKDKYTLLMADRTATRHQRRGYDRRQMVKRLFKLIWEKHLNLEWDKDVQQTISFLLNRRGFTFLTEEYDEEALRHFPKEAYKLLPGELKIDADESDEYDFASALAKWTNDGEGKVRERFRTILLEAYYEKIRKTCLGKKTDDIIKEGINSVKLGETPKDIFEKIFYGLPYLTNRMESEKYTFRNDQNEEITAKYNKGGTFNILSFINNNPAKVAVEILETLPQEKKEWLFNPIGNFNFEKNGEKLLDSTKIDAKLHLQHLAYALHKTLNELESGGRHRSKYFDEVRKVLRNERTKGRKKDGTQIGDDYIDRFCTKLKSGHYQRMDEEKLSRLICHLSNLELKPLRKYFNDKKHQKSDYWCETRLNKIFDRWILREWRVTREKDKDKAPDKPGDYNKLRKNWGEHKKLKPNTVVDFWLETNPFLTIPPYQDNNNRRPPRCQSLILNPISLDKRYPGWQSWLAELKSMQTVTDYLDDFEDQLKNLKSGKGNSYFSDKETKEVTKSGKKKSRQELKAGNQERRALEALDARTLQFIFDRVKANDPLNLNEIYSHAKKWRQKQSTEPERQAAKKKLEKSIKESNLPDGLITDSDYGNEGLFEEGTFLHLVCNYYKQRQRAKAGRLFIHPEYRHSKDRGHVNTGRFDDKNCLLTYCNHKPRQKEYQSFHDIAGVLQVSPAHLQQIIGGQSSDTLMSWLKEFRGLPKLCQDSADAQKEHRGILKMKMDSAIRGELKKDPLYKLNTSLEKIAKEVGKALFAEVEERVLEKKIEKFRSPFSFAQINNIAFKDRSGNSNTCAVCSIDNAHRMQVVASKTTKESHAKAQRLPAIPTRLIDGAVMRMTRIVGGAIADDKWEKIETELKAGKEVSVPIITESNRFEFEPNLKEIKGKNLKNTDKENREKGQEKLASSKNERIKAASQNVCPYTGKELSENIAADRDHIIPRSSEWGTLNDEANLIWASVEGNREVKQDNEFSLANLKSNYKREQFGKRTDEEIKDWIINEIGDGTDENFKFGRYRSFINLTPNQQTAFRHALFLIRHPLREKVINAIDNRTRTLVNGTQRYFAEVIANNLHKKARTIGKQNRLSFDFFGVEAQSNTRGDGIKDLRDEYEKFGLLDEKYSKQKGQKQLPYSHLIDAQLAFAIAADEHRKEGSLKLEIDNYTRLWPVDKSTGEMFQKTIFGSIRIKPEEMKPLEELSRRQAYTVETHHREMIAHNRKPSINYQIHRDSIFKENFFPILKFKDGTLKKGFNQSNCVDFDAIQFSVLLENHFIHQTSQNECYEVWNILKENCQQFLMKIGTVGANAQEIKIAKIIDKLAYQTIKKPLEKELSGKIPTPPKTVGEALERWDECIREENFKKDGVLLPAYYEWLRFHKCLLEAHKEEDFHDFAKNCSLFIGNQSKNGHNKVRKVFSLPVKSAIGSIRLQRKSWDKTQIIQVVAEESLAKYGYGGKDRPHTIISKHSVPIKHYTGIPDSWDLEPLEWKEIPVEEVKLSYDQRKNEIKNAKIKNKDAGRCKAKITVSSIENLSLPQDKSSWKGKVICHENERELEDAQGRDRNGNHHCLSSQYKWFDVPFALPNDRREVSIETTSEGIAITFTISKTRKIKNWLIG